MLYKTSSCGIKQITAWKSEVEMKTFNETKQSKYDQKKKVSGGGGGKIEALLLPEGGLVKT